MRNEGRGKGERENRGERREKWKKIEGKKVGGREVTCRICGSE